MPCRRICMRIVSMSCKLVFRLFLNFGVLDSVTTSCLSLDQWQTIKSKQDIGNFSVSA